MEHKVHVAKFIWAEFDPKIVLFSYLKARTAISWKAINDTGEGREVRLQQEQVFDQLKIKQQTKVFLLMK
jgi:hypothetical protein